MRMTGCFFGEDLNIISLYNMNSAFEKRKIELISSLKESYKSQPHKWWQTKRFVYKTTSEAADTIPYYAVPLKETVLRNNISSGIFFCFITLIFSTVSWIGFVKSEYNILGLIVSVFATALFVWGIIQTIDRKPKIILTEQGIWLNNIKKVIEWSDIATSYIKEDHTGEGISYSLIIFYYDLKTDGFISTEDKDIGSLEFEVNQIAYCIEYWKMKTGNLTPIV